MEIQPPFRVTPPGSFQERPDQFPENGITNELKNILLNLQKDFNVLADWIRKFAPNASDEEILVAGELLVICSISFQKHFDVLRDYIDKSPSPHDLHYALEVNAEIDDFFKRKIKILTLSPYWKIEDFSFEYLFLRADNFPMIDLKRMIKHLFKEISYDNWGQTQRVVEDFSSILV